MKNEEKTMTGEESLRIITEMIERTKVDISLSSFHFRSQAAGMDMDVISFYRNHPCNTAVRADGGFCCFYPGSCRDTHFPFRDYSEIQTTGLGGISFWIFSLVAHLGGSDLAMLSVPAAMLSGYLVPGNLLKSRASHDKV